LSWIIALFALAEHKASTISIANPKGAKVSVVNGEERTKKEIGKGGRRRTEEGEATYKHCPSGNFKAA